MTATTTPKTCLPCQAKVFHTIKGNTPSGAIDRRPGRCRPIALPTSGLLPAPIVKPRHVSAEQNPVIEFMQHEKQYSLTIGRGSDLKAKTDSLDYQPVKSKLSVRTQSLTSPTNL